MKKLKKMHLIELSSEQQREIRGGCFCYGNTSNWGNPIYCYDATPPKTTYCETFTCMPGDKADFGSWLGTRIAEKYF